MSRFATGVTVITTGGRAVHGMTANSFTSVSLDPPLVSCCVHRDAHMHDAIADAGGFAVSILSAGQEHVARYFADRGRPRGAAQFDRVDWSPGQRTGAPLLTGAAAWLECSLAVAHAGGDHTIFLGEVLGASWTPTPDALLFHAGRFHRLATESP
ncbi:flavin reductase family protein [Actinokineospora sp. NPDC004072]